MSDRDRDTLIASGIEAAVASGKLDLAAVSEWSESLNLDAGKRSEMQIKTVVNASRIQGEDSKTAPDWALRTGTAWLSALHGCARKRLPERPEKWWASLSTGLPPEAGIRIDLSKPSSRKWPHSPVLTLRAPSHSPDRWACSTRKIPAAKA